VMRQPLEDGTVCIARASMSLTFPARFMVAGAMNPCPCGFFNDRSRECHCSSPMIQRYMQKISGPLMDRIDIHIDVPSVNYKEMRAATEPEGSGQIRERIVRAREIQLRRFRGDTSHTIENTLKGSDKIIRPARAVFSNAQMTPRQIRVFCELSPDCER